MYRELLLGCGYRRVRLVDPYHWSEDNFAIPVTTTEERWTNVLTVDSNPDCAPDYLLNLEGVHWESRFKQHIKPEHQELFNPWPHQSFRDQVFDEVHAYEVLEHLGHQGDERSFFGHFEQIWRMLKPGGFLCATVPSRFSQWLWGDPGHRRAILPASLVFLQQAHYRQYVGKGPSSDYRSIYAGNFHIVHSSDNEETHMFVLQALHSQ